MAVSTGDAQLTQLDSGIRVVTEDVPSVRSVALGLWVRTGSRNETPAQAGVSHFLEHLLFKGTKRHNAIEIAEIFDGMGASINAATGKESTHLYARFLDTHTEKAFDLLSEMLLEPTYPEIDSERQVVIEEIAMYEDEPSDRVHDVLDEAVFGDHPLGRRVLGTAEVIGSIPVPDISDYHHSRYTADNVVVAAAGNVDHDAIVELATKYVNPTTESEGPAQPRAAQLREPLRLHAEGHRAVPRLPRRSRHRARRRPPLRSHAFSTPSSAGPPRRASSARFARSAASPTRSAPTRSSSSTAAWSASTSAPARTTSRRRAR